MIRRHKTVHEFANGASLTTWQEAGYWTGHIECPNGWTTDTARAFVRAFIGESRNKNPWQIVLPPDAPESLRRLFRRHFGEFYVRWRDNAEVWTRCSR